MTKKLVASVLFFAMLAVSSSNLFAATISIGNYVTSSSTITIPVFVSGGELIKEMTGVLVVGDGGTAIGSAPVPKITAVNYASSIWAVPSGGYSASFNPIFPLPSEFYFPNVSLNTPSASVAANGQLLNFTLNLAGFANGSTFALSMEYPPAMMATQFTLANGDPLVPAFINGSITIIPEPSSLIFSSVGVVLCGFGMMRMRSRARMF
jgi:hypothetical protein